MTGDTRPPGTTAEPSPGTPGSRSSWSGLAPALILSGNILAATVPLAALFPALAAALDRVRAATPRPVPATGPGGSCSPPASSWCWRRSGWSRPASRLSPTWRWSAPSPRRSPPGCSAARTRRRQGSGRSSGRSSHCARRGRRTSWRRSRGPWPRWRPPPSCSRLPGLSVAPPRASSAGLLAGWLIPGRSARPWSPSPGTASRHVGCWPASARLATGLARRSRAVAPGLGTSTLRPGACWTSFYLSGLAGAAATRRRRRLGLDAVARQPAAGLAHADRAGRRGSAGVPRRHPGPRTVARTPVRRGLRRDPGGGWRSRSSWPAACGGVRTAPSGALRRDGAIIVVTETRRSPRR